MTAPHWRRISANGFNRKITYLDSFAESFLPKCMLGQMISRYMVLIASEQKLLMMRPCQIYAVKHIVDYIRQNCGNGYIWHTTGSGKTLTSFIGTPIFEENASLQKIADAQAFMRTTKDLFQKQLHAYTITHAIKDQNVLRFHVDYFKVEGASSSTFKNQGSRMLPPPGNI